MIKGELNTVKELVEVLAGYDEGEREILFSKVSLQIKESTTPKILVRCSKSTTEILISAEALFKLVKDLRLIAFDGKGHVVTVKVIDNLEVV